MLSCWLSCRTYCVHICSQVSMSVQVMLPVTMLVEWLTGDSSFVDLFEPVVVFKVRPA